MSTFRSKNASIFYKQDRTVRVISRFMNGDYCTGTGFLINKNGNILTCWHVISGVDLKILKNMSKFQEDKSTSEIDKVNKYFLDKTSKIEIELSNGTKAGATLESYDYYYDIAVLKIDERAKKLPFFELELGESLDYSDETLFCGYPSCLGYDSLNSPFAVNTGTVSTFPEVEVAGGKYRNIQLNSICLGGNSGAPLFKKGSNKVCGIVNGLHWHGRDDFATYKEDGTLTKGSLHVTINISYATSFYRLMKESKIFKQLIGKA